MRRLSQKELLQEGIGSFIGGLGRVARKAATGAAKILAPKTMDALGKGATLAAGAIENIRSGSPSASIGTFLDSEDGKREFKGVKLGKETKLKNQNFKVEVKSGYYLNSLGGENIEEKDLTGGYFIVRRKNRGGGDGYDNEITEVYDNTGKRLNKNPIKAGTEVLKPAKAGEPDETGKAGGTNPEQVNGKPKFFETLKQWKIDKIGPSAGSVPPTGEHLDQFLKSLNVDNRERILKQAGIKHTSGGATNPKKLTDLEGILKARGIVAESKKSQKNLLKHLHYGSQMNK